MTTYLLRHRVGRLRPDSSPTPSEDPPRRRRPADRSTVFQLCHRSATHSNRHRMNLWGRRITRARCLLLTWDTWLCVSRCAKGLRRHIKNLCGTVVSAQAAIAEHTLSDVFEIAQPSTHDYSQPCLCECTSAGTSTSSHSGVPTPRPGIGFVSIHMK